MTVLEATGLVVRWPQGYELEVPEFLLPGGEVALVQGPNGAGKTTLLKCLGGLLVPRSGHVLLGGRPLYGVLGPRLAVLRMVSYVGARPYLFRGTVLDNLLLGPRWRGVGGREAQALIRREAGPAGLSGLLDRSVDTLSAGQVRRVALVRALVSRPQVLLLDEPEADLDDQGRAWLLERVMSFVGGDRAVLVATHRGELWENAAGLVFRLEQSDAGTWVVRGGRGG